MPDDVELEINTRTVTPTRGAVVKADYLSKVGRRVLMTLTTPEQFVPFGAVVTRRMMTRAALSWAIAASI